MSDNTHLALSNTLIAGRYAVDTSQVLVDAGGGIPAYLARDRLAGDARRVALAVSRDSSPRTRHLKILEDPIDNLMVPFGHGVAPLSGGKGEGYFIVCPSPPGPPVSAALNSWPEKALLDLVLAPIARVLEVMHSRNLTHRAIRPNNVFQAAPGQPVMLGAAWAAPPAMHQPVVFESPYSAMCHPAGRGEGSIADDVYALGVLLLTLVGGKTPMMNMDDPTIIRWKLDLGSFAALTRDVTLSSSLADLLRGMLAEDPDHRPLPGLLLDPGHARGRRIAARPARRSQRPLMINDIAVFDARMLGFALLSDERKAVQFLRNGLVTQWLRRGVGDAGMAAQIEDLVRGGVADTKSGTRGDPLLLMHTISAVNPRMPLCWRGVGLWPDALPSLLAEGIAATTDLLASTEELVIHDIAGIWSSVESRQGRPESPDMFQHRHLLRGGGPAGLLRLFYSLNPLLPCRGPAMAAEWIVSMPDLMRYLERAAKNAGEILIDLHIAAFVAARADRKIEMQVSGLASAKDADSFRLAELALLRDLQSRYFPSPMPALAKWAAGRLRRDLERWRNRTRRDALKLRLDALAQAGFLSRLLALTEDVAARTLDSVGAQGAANEMAMIDAELAAIDHGDKARFADAERFGQAITGGIGLSAFILTVMAALLR
jgi:hypothetical protein